MAKNARPERRVVRKAAAPRTGATSKRSKKLKQTATRHVGKLSWASLFHYLPDDLLVPGRSTEDDPHGLSWEVGENARRLNLRFARMLYATAEAAVTLGVFADAIRRRWPHSLRIAFDNASSKWVAGLGLDQLSTGTWQRPQRGWTNPLGCYAYPLRRILLEGSDDVANRAAALAKAIRLLPEDVFPQVDKDKILAAVERVAYEAFLNIVEHAYLARNPRYLYACATVTPATYFEDNNESVQPYTTAEDRRWLRDHTDSMILEIALADGGEGIPFTLWNDAVQKRRPFTQGWEPGPLQDAERRAAHHALCDYAFRHDSTRKHGEDFTNVASQLSWRGLHSCTRQTESLSGYITLASGEGRAGYVTIDNRLIPISPGKDLQGQFPGTLVVLRFPTICEPRKANGKAAVSRPVPLRIGFSASEAQWRKEIAVEQVEEAMRPRNSEPNVSLSFKREIDSGMDVAPQIVGARFPFQELAREPAILSLLRLLPPNYVAALLFVDVPLDVRAQLRAYTESDWSPITHGTPRLLLVWDREAACFRWQFAGEFPLPKGGQKLYSDLEMLGRAELAEEIPALHALARDLATAYKGLITWDEKVRSLSFLAPEVQLAKADYERELQAAFSDFYAARQSDFVFTCAAGDAVRIPTGRLVTKFLSVLNMLRSAPQLVVALRHRFSQIIGNVKESDYTIFADGPASYFVANLLFRGADNFPRVRLIDPVRNASAPGKPVLFVDVIFSGETIRRAVKQLETFTTGSGTVIACVDMRRIPSEMLEGSDWRVQALLQFYFKAGEWTLPTPPNRVFEVDRRTHVPFNRTSLCEFTELATTSVGQTFLQQNPNMFVCGFHEVAGRVHTVSLSTQKIVSAHRRSLITLLADETIRVLNSLPKRALSPTLILFCRPESKVYAVIHEVAEELPRRSRRIRSVYVSHLTIGPIAPRLVFPRIEDNILGDVQNALSQTSLFNEPIREFVGTYIDDASVTGKALQDFITKASCLNEPAPKALSVILVVNRLSPRETRFLNVCREVSSPVALNVQRSRSTIPFRLGSIFRLQVKAADEREVDSAPYTIRQLARHAEFFDARLRAYVNSISANIDTIFRRVPSERHLDPVLLHPFYPIASAPSSISLAVVNLRHLLSLNQQNEGVMSDVLHAVTALIEAKDHSLITMLALEPHLLGVDPLAIECWPNLRGFCLELLASETSNISKSDALAVLYHRREDIVGLLPRVLASTAADEHLLTQSGAFLLSLSQRDRSWRESIRKALDDVSDRVPLDVTDWLRSIIDTPAIVEDSYLVRDDAEAVAKIHALIAATWTHVGLEEWQAFDLSIKNLTRATDRLSARDSALGLRCIEYSLKYLISGLAGMRWVALKRSLTGDAVKLAEAIVGSIHAGIRMRHLLQSGDVTRNSWRIDISSTWNVLRRLTLKAATPVRTLGQVQDISEEPSVIEAILPRLYSAPFPLLQKLAQQLVPDLAITADQNTFIAGAIIVPVSRYTTNEFFRILLENMAKYGQPGSCTAALETEHYNDSIQLQMTFTDRRKPEIAEGGGAGIPLLKEYARRGSFGFKSWTQGMKFVTTVVVPNALHIAPQMTRR
jgi:hypothetical protein